MKTIVGTVVALLCAAGLASAQDDRDRKMDELKRDFEKSMKGLQQKFDAERERMEREFRAARERLLGKKDEDSKPHSTEDMLKRVLERLDQLEKRLDHEMPRFKGLERLIPEQPFRNFEQPFRQFDFKNFGENMPEEWRKWLEQMPRFKGSEDFKFEFRRGEPKKGEDREPEKEKPGKKKEKKESDSF